MLNRLQWAGLAVWVAVSFSASVVGGLATDPSWYLDLERPGWAPPPWLFGPVWTVLYALMGVAAWLVWKNHRFSGARLALSLFLVQLVLNAAWSWLFFGLREPGLAFAEILILWAFILATVAAFRPKHGLAAVLLIPYLAWVTYAAVLNYALWRLNQ
jgi:translocator protein